jgi:hypothetical protein
VKVPPISTPTRNGVLFGVNSEISLADAVDDADVAVGAVVQR